MLAALALLAGCGEPDIILPGERLAIRADADAFANVSRPVPLPAAVVNSQWTHVGGAADHLIGHPALAGNLQLVFATPIGQGDTRRSRITASPVVADGTVYTMDSTSIVSAVSASTGALLWQADVSPVTDRPEEGSGGGLAVSGGRLFVSTGYGRLTALDARTGGEVWVQDLNAAGAGAPTVAGDLVYVVARDSRVWAIERGTGQVRWQQQGIPGEVSYSGGAGAAVSGDVAVFPFPSGEVIATFPAGGNRRWANVIAGDRPGSALGTITSDFGADPVIEGGVVYIGNLTGRVVALDLESGDRLWTATEGAAAPLWVAGGSVFFVDDLGELTRLDAATGAGVWRVPLPRFESDRPRRQNTRWVHQGPVLAGGRLLVASSDGYLRSFAPASGALIGAVQMPEGAASGPVVAGGMVFVVSEAGRLLAFR